MTAIVFQKFFQNRSLAEKLLDTGIRPLCEATKDKEWGIGMGFRDAERYLQSGSLFVQGQNLMGLVLMDVRKTLAVGLWQPFSEFLVIGDSLMHGTESDRVKVVCVPGA